MLPPMNADWLREPRVELFMASDGAVESAYVALRDAPYARAVQPDPSHLVFLYMGRDRMPIGVCLLEPAVGAVGAEVVRRLLAEPEAATQNGAGAAEGPLPMTLEQLDVVIHRLKEASERLPVPAAGG